MSAPSGSPGGGGEDSTRRIRDMQDLLKFCITGTSGEDASNSESRPALSEERKAWLDEALKSMSVDVIQEMIKALANIRRAMEKLNNPSSSTGAGDCTRDDEDVSVEEIVSSIDVLVDITEDLDLATDFDKIGGFGVLLPLLQSCHFEVNKKSCELIGTLVENHEQCQAAAINAGLLNALVSLLDSSKDLGVKTKALYATSCLLRGNPISQQKFVKELDGFSILMRSMQFEPQEKSDSTEICRLRTKCAFLLGELIKEGGHQVKEELLNMGFIEQLVGLLHLPHDGSHEHLLNALLILISDCPSAIQECTLRSELQLPTFLHKRIEFLRQKHPELEEERQYCYAILDLIKSNVSSVANDDSER